MRENQFHGDGLSQCNTLVCRSGVGWTDRDRLKLSCKTNKTDSRTFPDDTGAPPSTANAPITHSKPVVDKDGCQVMVVNKVVSVYDADGKLLRTESITDYTKKNILDSFATIDTFTSKWKELKKSQTLLIC